MALNITPSPKVSVPAEALAAAPERTVAPDTMDLCLSQAQRHVWQNQLFEAGVAYTFSREVAADLLQEMDGDVARWKPAPKKKTVQKVVEVSEARVVDMTNLGTAPTPEDNAPKSTEIGSEEELAEIARLAGEGSTAGGIPL